MRVAHSGTLTLGSSLEKASARLLLKRAATLPNMECRSAGSRMGDNTCTHNHPPASLYAKFMHESWGDICLLTA